MSDNLFDILDDCLSRLDSGEDIESCLGRYPRQASELRPLLFAAMDAVSIAPAATVPPEVMKRGKAKLLNAAAEMREQKAAARNPIAFNWKFPLRRLVAVLAVLLAFVLLGGTGLVRASSASMPGDQLYTVKRSWENVLLQVVTDPQAREKLEVEFENERIDELKHLTGSGREAEVEFSDVVTGVFPDQIIVADVPVYITQATAVEGNIQLGVTVKVEGQTRADGSVLASEIKVLGPGNANDSEGGDSSGSGNPGEVEDTTKTPEIHSSETPEPPEKENNDKTQNSTESPALSQFEIEGIIQSFSGNQIVVDKKIIIFNAGTEIRGTLASGARVKVKGFVESGGSLVATRIEIESSSSEATVAPTNDNDSVATPNPSPTSDDSGPNNPTETPKPDDD